MAKRPRITNTSSIRIDAAIRSASDKASSRMGKLIVHDPYADLDREMAKMTGRNWLAKVS